MRTARDLALRFAAELGSAVPTLAWRIAHPGVVGAAWAVSLSYCAVDIGTDVYDTTLRGEGLEHLALQGAERAAFHAVASVALPYVAVSQATQLARLAFGRLGVLPRVGPALVGLACIPLLPLLIDKPVAGALHRYAFGPLRVAVDARLKSQRQRAPAAGSPRATGPSLA